MLTKVINQNSVDRFVKWIENAEKMVIVTHVSPDGDAIGSSLGLWHFLRGKGKDVTIIVPNSFPDFLKWMPGAADIVVYDKDKEAADKLMTEADVVCCLDFNQPSRVASMEEILVSVQARKILIDHHLDPSDFCNIVISHPELPATAEVVLRIICAMGCWGDLSKEAAECIYTGMMTDTGGFTYNSNNPEIYFLISQLLTKGIDKDKIYRRVFNTQSEGRMRLMGFVLNEKMTILPDFATSVITLTKKELSKFAHRKGDTEGFVNMPLSIQGIKLSVFLREDDDMIKVSMRSVGELPCNEIARKYFGGGGHKNAAGGEFYGTMEDAEKTLKDALIKEQDMIINSRD